MQIYAGICYNTNISRGNFMENSFGEFLKQKRQEKNLTQKELAKALFVTESAVSKWEYLDL